MKLGNHTIGLRKRVPRLDEDGKPVRSSLGAELVDVVDVKVRWCSVTPTTRTSANEEPQDRTGPTLTGMTLLAPPSTELTERDVVIWPITGEETVDGVLQLSGPEHQVEGEPAVWDYAIEAELRKSS